jgi:peptidoglycan DL-endopeptidase CwlO
MTLVILGCTHGAPLGGRLGYAQSTYQPLSPASHPRRTVFGFLLRQTAEDAAVERRERLVKLAKGLVGRQQVRIQGQPYSNDCTGLVQGLYRTLGFDLLAAAKPGDNGVTAMYRFVEANGTLYRGGWPAAGDLVFFRETYDQNRDGRVNDGLTHVGIVEGAFADGTITVIHHVSQGIVRYRMNLKFPSTRLHPKTGAMINDYLRTAEAGQTEALTAELFAGFASVLPTGNPVAAR